MPARTPQKNRFPTRTGIEMSYRLRLARRSSIDEPEELTDGLHACRRDLAAPCANHAKNRLLLAASNEERDPPTTFNHRIRHCYAHLGAAAGYGRHPSFLFLLY